jgi:hypothetical protein
MKQNKFFLLAKLFTTLGLCTCISQADSYLAEHGECLVKTDKNIEAALLGEKAQNCAGSFSFTWDIDHNVDGTDSIRTSLDTPANASTAVIKKYNEANGELIFNSGNNILQNGGVSYNVNITTTGSTIYPTITFKIINKGKTSADSYIVGDSVCKVSRYPTAMSRATIYYTNGGEAAWNKAKTPSGCAVS